MTIKKIEDLKGIQIVCKYPEQVKECIGYLKQLGFKVDFNGTNIQDFIIKNSEIDSNIFFITTLLNHNMKIEFYNKKLRKTLEKFVKQKEEKEKIKDFEVDNEGRILKINNWEIRGDVFYHEVIPYLEDHYYENVGIETPREALEYNKENFEKLLNLGLLFNSEEALERYLFKLKIETKLRNIAERLNKGQKIDWNDGKQGKFYIFYYYPRKSLDCEPNFYSNYQGNIYCLDENFLDVAKKEIGEENLIKYFKE